MSGARELVMRFVDRFHGGPEVGPAKPADLADCVAMAWESVHEQGLPVTIKTAEALAKHLAAIVVGHLMKEAVLLVARHRGEVAGMVACGIAPPDPWDTRVVMHVWLLHVKREARHTARTVVALIRAAIAAGEAWGAQRARLTVSDRQQRLVDLYQKRLGFRLEMTHRTYALDWRD